MTPSKSLTFLKCLMLVAVTAASCLSIAKEPRPITLQDLQSLSHNSIYYLQVSPDGRRIVYTTWGNAAEGEGPESNLWIVDARPNSTPRQIGRGLLPHWSPDGEHLAYYTPSLRNRQLWVVDVRTGKSRQITHLRDGIQISQNTFFDGWWFDPLWYCWSPDGTKLAFTSLTAKEGAQPGIAPIAKQTSPGADPSRDCL